MENMDPDFLNLSKQFTDIQYAVQSSVRSFVKKEVEPIIEQAALEGIFPAYLFKKMADLGLYGSTLPEIYGGVGLDYIAYGLMLMELESGDSGLRSTASVQSALVMNSIFFFGSEEQKSHYLPRLASGEMIGCFGLTEPEYGSDPGSLVSRFVEKDDYFLLNGSKTWITNAPIADLAIVWAKNAQGRIQGLIVEKETEGFTRTEIEGKWSLRTSKTGELAFHNCKVSLSQLLPLSDGLRAPLKCLDEARYGIAWGTLGVAMTCYRVARKYALERSQFGRPLAGFQLIQKKLAEMLTQITQAQWITYRVGQLKNEGQATSAMISMIKRNNAALAQSVALQARQILGGNGITSAYPIMRHLNNLESVITYEGTHDIHLLILGQEITGIPAFK